MRFEHVTSVDEEIIAFAKALGASWVGGVKVEPYEHSIPFNCHNNVDPDLRVTGYTILRSEAGLHALLHSVEERDGTLVDVSPNYKEHGFSIFARTDSDLDAPEHLMYAESSVIINNYDIKRSLEPMYYIYALIDPRNNKPFYVGKGKGDRWKHHARETKEKTENWHKYCIIQDILNETGDIYKVEFLAHGIEKEETAYLMESEFIKQYGMRKNGGSLVNICEDQRPPSHKGKTYKEIYGDRAEEQIEKRAKLQRARGGYMLGKKHSEQTKKILSEKMSGNQRLLGHVHSEESRARMSENQKLQHRERSKKYILTHEPSGARYEVLSVDLPELCKRLNISRSTLQAQILKGWGRSKKGKTAGWLLEKTHEVV